MASCMPNDTVLTCINNNEITVILISVEMGDVIALLRPIFYTGLQYIDSTVWAGLDDFTLEKL